MYSKNIFGLQQLRALLGLEGWKFIPLYFGMIYIWRKQLFLPSECLATEAPCTQLGDFLQMKSHLFFQGLVSLHGQGSTKFCLWFLSYSSQQPYFRCFPPTLHPAFFLPSQSQLKTTPLYCNWTTLFNDNSLWASIFILDMNCFLELLFILPTKFCSRSNLCC